MFLLWLEDLLKSTNQSYTVLIDLANDQSYTVLIDLANDHAIFNHVQFGIKQHSGT